ncbi:hypothetical protein LQW54_013128 [Pestalotiopsis sp. IQ-011]
MSTSQTANDEVRSVPPGWKVLVTQKSGRVHYYHPEDAPDGTYDHPVSGSLPKDWRMFKTTGGYFYYNIETGKRTIDRPGSLPDPKQQPTPKQQPAQPNAAPKSVAPKAVRKASPPPASVAAPPGFAKVKAGMNLERNEIASAPLDDRYDVIKVIDPGDGTKGGMNDGIFVVRHKPTQALFIQKKFKSDNDFLISMVKKEIRIMRELKCNSLVQYVDVEFCDCGDLGELIKAYRLRKHKHKTTEYIPESFIWHAFLALMDGLHFLATGCSYMSVDLNRGDIDATKKAKPWTPIVHRDIKCDNVMLKSRSTPGSTKPLYVILTDFGMAEPEPVSTKPPWLLYGTPEYHAPELCFAPYLTKSSQLEELRSPHTCKSDMWAVACIMHALCERDIMAHMDMNCWALPDPTERQMRWRGRAARKEVLQITDRSIYSDRLEYSIKYAGEKDPKKRPTIRTLIPKLRTQMEKWRADPNWKEQSDVNCRLPDWAVNKSDLV